MSNVNTENKNVNTSKEDVNTNEKITKEKWIQIRVKEETKQKIKEFVLNSDYKNISQFFLDSVLTKINGNVLTNEGNVNTIQKNVLTNRIDTNILKKLLKPFAEKGINVKLEKEEIKRVKELWEEISNE